MALQSKVTIYTDGACEPNPGVGGWAAILLYNSQNGSLVQKEIYGSHPKTTNNRMEITGVIESLKLLKRPCDVTVISDSKYVVGAVGNWVNGIQQNGWMIGWKDNGWKRKDGHLLNVDLWQEIHEIAKIHESIVMKWVRGHTGDPLNERCDQLAGVARKTIYESASN